MVRPNPSFLLICLALLALAASSLPQGYSIKSRSASTGGCPLRVVGSNTQGLSIVSTPLGLALGVLVRPSVSRFTVKYASAQRWQPSTLATTWKLPNDFTNASALPPMCPQPFAQESSYSEDCLFMVIYVPTSLPSETNAATLLWIHGGSFVIGSASDPTIDGSALAEATNSIIVVIQYRLGALGFIAPNGQTNLGLKDVANALRFLHIVLPSFGGDGSMITLAGQSSGATMIRALLAAPSVQSLFRFAILQSDPMDYGFLSALDQETLQNYCTTLLQCKSSDSPCLDELSLALIMNATITLFNNAFTIVPAAQVEPIRVVNDGSFITSTLDSSSPFPNVSKPILLSNVRNEAGFITYTEFPDPVSLGKYQNFVNASVGEARYNALANAEFYAIKGSLPGFRDYRPKMDLLGTDAIWRCPTWTFARNWVAHGGTAYVGLYTVGASYPGNSEAPFCAQPGVVCHQDDIEIVFGTVPNPSSVQSALIAQMQARYKSFLYSGNPNSADSSSAEWKPAETSEVHAILLGSPGSAPVCACTEGFWGSTVPYDYQVYNI